MRIALFLMLLPLLLGAQVRAAELPEDLQRAVPEGAEFLLEESDFSGIHSFSRGISQLWDRGREQLGLIWHRQVRGAASILAAVLLCSAAEGLFLSGPDKAPFLLMAGVLTITAIAAGSLDTLIGLGTETIGELHRFSRVLLPAMAAAAAASGAVTAAAFQQVTAVFLADLLISLIRGLLLPLLYLYIGTLTAACCLPESRLGALADGLKKLITWSLTSVLLAFTLYLSLARVITGSADAAAVKLTKTVISGVVPVVGGILAEASETVLAGAGLLRSSIGIFGTLAVLGACLYPFVQLGVQYLLYKLTAFLAGIMGPPGLCRLIDGLGGAFGLVLGMTGSCALLLMVSVASSMAAVLP